MYYFLIFVVYICCLYLLISLIYAGKGCPISEVQCDIIRRCDSGHIFLTTIILIDIRLDIRLMFFFCYSYGSNNLYYLIVEVYTK